MQALLNFEFDTLRVPQHYNHILQAFILKLLDENYASFVHDRGYQYEGRVYKLFTFSRLYGDFERDGTRRELLFKNHARLYVSCVDDEFFNYVVEKALTNRELQINRQPVMITKISLIDEKFAEDDEVIVRAVSPVTVHTTVHVDGRKFTKFYTPDEPDFADSLVRNLKSKFRSFHRCQPSGEIEIEPLPKSMEKVVVNYKNIYVVGWRGLWKLKGSGELIKFALDAGLGAKTAEGFGCILVYSRKLNEAFDRCKNFREG